MPEGGLAPSPHLSDAHVATALSEEFSRRILAVCIRKARSAKEIEQETQLPQATVYRYVHQLVGSRLLLVERSAITPDGKRYDLFRSRIRSARLELDGSGVRIVWEPTEGTEERLARVWATLRGI